LAPLLTSLPTDGGERRQVREPRQLQFANGIILAAQAGKTLALPGPVELSRNWWWNFELLLGPKFELVKVGIGG
jgi:hypothetical protein